MKTFKEVRISNDETREMQQYILDILKAIDKVCREHGLRYYMIAGTLLGAVRHKGFVPWDDDADVALPRKDYDVLLEHANEWLPEPYRLVHSQNDEKYPYDFARVEDVGTTYVLRRRFDYVGGLPVDVFPLDGMTANPLKRWWHYRRYNFWKRILYYSQVDPYKHGKNWRTPLIKKIHQWCDSRRLHRKMDNIQREYDIEATGLIADHDNKPFRGILPSEVYGTPVPMPFEDTTLMGVAQPDEYLSYCYGDYMQMPKQLPPQNFRVLDLKLPFKTYLEQGGHG